MTQNFPKHFLNAMIAAIEDFSADTLALRRFISELRAVRYRKGRLFLLGVGGSASDCLHAAADFRKFNHIEAYAPTGNISEVTARTNDGGWESTFVDYLAGSNLNQNDLILVLSVGGGTSLSSPNILEALEYADGVNTPIIGITGTNGGRTRELARACLRVDSVPVHLLTPITHSMQSIILHLLFSHPELQP